MSYHDEIRELLAGIEDGALAEGNIFPGIEGLKTQAERLLALPEASIEMLVQAAQLGVGAVEAALAEVESDETSGEQADGYLRSHGLDPEELRARARARGEIA